MVPSVNGFRDQRLAAGMAAVLVAACAALGADDGSTSSDAARSAYAAAAALQNREAWELAAEEWTSLIASHSSDPLALKARYYLGICQARNDDWPSAARTFRDVLGSQADAATKTLARWELGRGSFLTAQKAASPEAYKEAAASLRDFLAQSPQHPQRADAMFFLGESLWQTGEREAAIDAWAKATREAASSPRMPELLYALGTGLMELKRPGEALAPLEKFAASFPDHALADDVAIWRADAAVATGKPADAEKILGTLASGKGARVADALERLGAVRWSQKKWSDSAAAYAALADRDPDGPRGIQAAASAGRGYANAGMPDKARPLLLKAASTPGGSGADAAHSLALLELAAKQPARALEIVSKKITELSAAKDRDSARLARLELDRADALWDIPERRKEAAAAYAEVATRYPSDQSVALPALAMTALALLDQGKATEALAKADEFLAAPGAAGSGQRLIDVRAIRAEALMAKGDHAAAAKAYRDLIESHAAAAQRANWQVREGVALAAAKQWQRSHETLAAAVASLSGDAAAEAMFLDATALVELDKPADAVTVLASLEKKHPAWPRREEAMLLGVRARREAGDPKAALAQAEALVKEFPSGQLADVAWYRLGQLRQDASRHDDAIEAFTTARARKPSGSRAPWALLAAGWCHEAKGTLPAAITAWSELITSYPDSGAATAALLARGDARYRSGDFQGGLDDATAFLKAEKKGAKDDASAAEARMLGGLCLVGVKRYADAVKAFQKLVDADPAFPAADRAAFEMGVAQLLDGKRDDAEKTFRIVVSRYPDGSRTPEAWFEIGEARFEAEAWDDAIKAYVAVIAAAAKKKELDALAEQARHKLGWSQSMKKDHAAAAKAFTEQVERHPKGSLKPDALVMLGESLFQAGDQAAASTQFSAALADPASISSDDLRGLALIRNAECAAGRRDWQASLKLAEQLDRTLPASPYAPQARYAAAWAKQNLGQLDPALDAYRALADGRTEIAARARLMEGEVLFEKGQHKDAIKAFFKVAYGFGERNAPAAFHPWQAQATYEAARCFEAVGEPGQAAKLYAELVEWYPDSRQTPAARKRLEALGPVTASPGK